MQQALSIQNAGIRVSVVSLFRYSFNTTKYNTNPASVFEWIATLGVCFFRQLGFAPKRENNIVSRPSKSVEWSVPLVRPERIPSIEEASKSLQRNEFCSGPFTRIRNLKLLGLKFTKVFLVEPCKTYRLWGQSPSVICLPSVPSYILCGLHIITSSSGMSTYANMKKTVRLESLKISMRFNGMQNKFIQYTVRLLESR